MNRVRTIFGDWAEPLLRGLITGLERDYAANAERYDESLGDNALSFGWLVAHNAPAFLEDELAGLPGTTFSRPNNSFQAELRGMILHPCKAGSEPRDDVHAALLDGSITRQRFVAANTEQFALFYGDGTRGWLPGDDEGTPRLRHLVIAHCGNPRDGLCWVCLGAPHGDGRNGSPWYWVEEIFRAQATRSDTTLAAGGGPPPITPFHEMPEPVPQLDIDDERADEAQGDQPA